MKSLIIEKPGVLNLRQRYIDNTLKFLIAVTWFYLMIPVLTLVNWLFAYAFFNQNLILLEGYKEYQTETSRIYLLIILGMFVFMMLWSKFNRLLDYERDQKQFITPVSTQQLASDFQLPVDDIKAWRKVKRMKVHYDDNGRISAVDNLD